MADMIDEINEDLRRQQLTAFWKENRNWIIGGIILSVVSTGALSWWRQHQMQNELAATAALVAAVDTGDVAKISDYAKTTGKDHGAIARFAEAGLLIQKGDKDKAAAVYSDIAATSGADRALRDLAALYSINLRLDKDDVEKLHKELAPLVADKSVWKFSAMESQSLLFAREGKKKEAADVLGKITGDAGAPEDIRTRALTLRELYLADSGKE